MLIAIRQAFKVMVLVDSQEVATLMARNGVDQAQCRF